MIQFNLLPDVKIQYLKARRNKANHGKRPNAGSRS